MARARPARLESQSAQDDPRGGASSTCHRRHRKHADAVFAPGTARGGQALAPKSPAFHERRDRGPGRGQPDPRLSRRPETQRHGRRLLRRRGREDPAAGRADALARTPVRLRHFAAAARQPQAATRALGLVERVSGAHRRRARPARQASRREDRSRPGRCAVHGLRHTAPQSRSEVAAAADCGRRASSHPEFAPVNAAGELARAGIALDTGPMLRLFPHRHGCDGFFAAVLERAR